MLFNIHDLIKLNHKTFDATKHITNSFSNNPTQYPNIVYTHFTMINNVIDTYRHVSITSLPQFNVFFNSLESLTNCFNYYYLFRPKFLFRFLNKLDFLKDDVFNQFYFNIPTFTTKTPFVLNWSPFQKIIDLKWVSTDLIKTCYNLYTVSYDEYGYILDKYHMKFFDHIEDWKFGPAPESSYDKFMRENPNYKLYYPEPYIASPSFAHEDIWFLHILHYQYWLWFLFITLVMFYFISFVVVVRWCNVRTRPRRATRGVSRSKCADCITATVPLIWAISILIFESFDSVDYNDGFGSSEMILGIRAFQWGWEYYYPKNLDLHYNVSGSYSTLIGNSLKYSSSSSLNNNTVDFWKFYQNSRKNSPINSPANFILSPVGDSKFLNFFRFKDIGGNSKNVLFSFKKANRPSFTQPQYLYSNFSLFTNRYNKLNSFYKTQTTLNDSVSHGFVHSFNYISNLSFYNSPRTFLDIKSFDKFLNYNLNISNYNSTKFMNGCKNMSVTTFFNYSNKFKLNLNSINLNVLNLDSNLLATYNTNFNKMLNFKISNIDFYNSTQHKLFFNLNLKNYNSYLSNSNIVYNWNKRERIDNASIFSYGNQLNFYSKILLNYTFENPTSRSTVKKLLNNSIGYFNNSNLLNSNVKNLYSPKSFDHLLGLTDYNYEDTQNSKYNSLTNLFVQNKTFSNFNITKPIGPYIFNNFDILFDSKFRIANSITQALMNTSYPIPLFKKYDSYSFLYRWYFKNFENVLQRNIINYENFENDFFNAKFFKRQIRKRRNFNLFSSSSNTLNINPNFSMSINFSNFSVYAKLLMIGDQYLSKKTSLQNLFPAYLNNLIVDNIFFNASSYRNIINNFEDKLRSDTDTILGLYNNTDLDNFNSSLNFANFNQFKFSEVVPTRITVKNTINTTAAYRRAFKVKDDSFTTHSGIHNMSNSRIRLPLYVDYEVKYKKMLAKNSLTFFDVNIYKRTILKNFNNLYSIWNSFNSRVFELPFLVSLMSEPTRNVWFDWYTRWSMIVLKPSTLERFSLMGLKYTNKFFEYEAWSRKEIRDSETYLTKLSHSRKNYLPGWATSSYLYYRSTNWYRKNFATQFNNAKISTLVRYYLFMANDYPKFDNIETLISNDYKNIFVRSNSHLNTNRQSFWQPIVKNNNYTFVISKLEDILSNREFLYRKFLSNQNYKHVVPSNLVLSSNNNLLTTVKHSIQFNNPTSLNSEFTRDFTYNDYKFLKIILLKDFVLFLNSKLVETPLNVTKISNYILFKFFGESTNNSNVNFISNFYKSQHRPMRKGITNMLKIQAAGAIAIPTDIRIHIVASSRDVIHSWAIPSAGIKIDCIPGFSSHRITMFLTSGIYWGQCMEICGRFHHWMPIVVYFLQRDLFVLWCSHFIHYDFNVNIFNMNDKQIRDHARILSYNKSSWVQELLK